MRSRAGTTRRTTCTSLRTWVVALRWPWNTCGPTGTAPARRTIPRVTPSRAKGGVEPIPVYAVGFDDDAERSLLGFAASEDNPDDVLVVARGKRFGADEVALGMDTYCVITGISGATHYGGVDEVSWPEPNRVRLSLSREASETLMLPRELELALPDESVDLVRAQLPALLGG